MGTGALALAYGLGFRAAEPAGVLFAAVGVGLLVSGLLVGIQRDRLR